MRKIQALVTVDLDSGEYEIVYKNVSNPGESIDFTEASRYLRAVFLKNEKQVNADAESGETAQAKHDKGDLN